MTTLTADEQAMLAGDAGPAVAFAMRIVHRLAEGLGAPRLQEITAAHVDGCLYNGQVNLDFATRLVDLGARVAVPTTLNVGSLDLLHPEIHRGLARDTDTTTNARALMAAYRTMGCAPTWTCAPYQLARRPEFGEHVAFAESNAIAFVNSVLGARTDRYGDFIDICAAITARVPYAGLHRDEARRATVVLDCRELPPELFDDTSGWAVLGYLTGSRTTGVPALTGLTAVPTEDDLKAFAATAASAGGVALFHIAGVTPEATEVRGLPVITVSPTDFGGARRALTTVEDAPVDAVSVGTPHFSASEFAALAALVRGRSDPKVPFYVSTSRAVLDQAADDASACAAAGITLITDTCTYVSSIVDPKARVVMTNSGKWAWYAPVNLGVDVVFGTLAECVRTAYEGQPR
ncbi:aconitase X [Labedaea rhizosphaerae]|uniref:Putative aconitase subunit 1 n=1 Tax=Labedaea rhizosphaerae TaxID=598644 RepID=A0A4R6RVM7_LABRH|nr:aconitase X catalytic domain-containing protein [Labedaea rhizosphaerae]TDP91041.1 putative aconitase subunit 1 [Labedaea rhizosphaerae]